MLESFRADISYMQENFPERKKAKAKELEEHRIREEYLHYEVNNVLCIKTCRSTRDVTSTTPARSAVSRSTSKCWRPGGA